ncbi:TPA: hypothetical protein QDZ23_004034 [Pseudomonas putida]|nr:hypothetical protein [Pseudomonas putida]
MISIYIDGNVWNLLFDNGIDLVAELPPDRFCLCMTQEAQFEIPPIPAEKAELKAFIVATVAKAVKTVPLFGFYNEEFPEDQQRYAGFDQGYFASDAELAFIEQQRTTIGATLKKKSKLYPNEADVSLASRSFDAYVLTLDAKEGPLNTAYNQGGKIIFLTEFCESGLSLGEFVERKIGQVKCE